MNMWTGFLFLSNFSVAAILILWRLTRGQLYKTFKYYVVELQVREMGICGILAWNYSLSTPLWASLIGMEVLSARSRAERPQLEGGSDLQRGGWCPVASFSEVQGRASGSAWIAGWQDYLRQMSLVEATHKHRKDLGRPKVFTYFWLTLKLHSCNLETWEGPMER